MIEDTWKNFELSGKVKDYLNYRYSAVKNSYKQESTQMSGTENPSFSDRGMDGYGTERGSDRNDTKCNADWRV